MKKIDIALLTDSRYVNPTIVNPYIQNILLEDRLLIKALEDRGLRVIRVDWADPNFEWASVKLAVFRTTWDYFDRIDEFIKWINQTKEVLHFINPVELVLWNIDKHYLQDLSDKGVEISETIFIEPGEKVSLREVFVMSGWHDAILKPAISGGARHTYRLSVDNLASHEGIFRQLIKNESLLLQPFQNSILTKGEVTLMYFNSKYSHAILKLAKTGDFRVQDDFGGTVHPHTATVDEMTLGQKAIEACIAPPLYGRVDIIEDNFGKPAVSELELIEPELWFRNRPESAEDLADAILDYAKGLAIFKIVP